MNFKNFLQKICLLLLTLGSFSTISLAQLKMQHRDVNLFVKTGVGYLRASKFNKQNYSGASEDYQGQTPYLVFGGETALWRNLAVGGIVGFSKFHTDQKDPYSAAHYTGDIQAYNVFLTLKYFLPITFGKISPYIHTDLLGLTAYSKRTYTVANGTSSLIEPSIDITENYGIYAGANYQLAGRLSAFAEIGYGYTGLNFGLNFNIPD